MATEAGTFLRGGCSVTCQRAQAEAISVLIPTATCSRWNAVPSVVGEGWGLLCLYIPPPAYQAGAPGTTAAPSREGVDTDLSPRSGRHLKAMFLSICMCVCGV